MDLLRQFLVLEARWDYDEFTSIWNAAASRDDVAKHFGVTPAHASAIAGQLRALGYELKKHARGRKLGSRLPPPDKNVELPSKEEFLQMWNADPSVAHLSVKLGLPPATVKNLLIQLKSQGEDVKAARGKGRPNKIDLDPRTYTQIHQTSDSYREIVDKLIEFGYDLTPEELYKYAVTMAHRINKLRRAQGKDDLKKLERPAYHRTLKFADEPSVPDIDDEDIAFDAGESDPWAEDTQPDETIPGVEEPGYESPDDEFVRIWNSASDRSGAFRGLRKAGWELSTNELSNKARWLRKNGMKLKDFID